MKIFYDVDTQNDFMNKDGALYVPDAELIKPNLKLLTNYIREKKRSSGDAAGNNVLVGSVDRHFGTEEYKEREPELKRNGGPFQDHCMDKTVGQLKNRATIPSKDYDYIHYGFLGKDSTFDEYDQWKHYSKYGFYTFFENYLDTKKHSEFLDSIFTKNRLVNNRLKNLYGLYFEKQNIDVFTNPGFELFLEKAGVKEAVVYGVATDYCIKADVLGMQKRDVQCYVVEDAIKGINPETSKEALDEMIDSGARLVRTEDILRGKLK